MIAWTAFVLALLELAFLLAVVWLVMRVWRQAAPTVKPMLAMFGNVPAGTTSTADVPAPKTIAE